MLSSIFPTANSATVWGCRGLFLPELQTKELHCSLTSSCAFFSVALAAAAVRFATNSSFNLSAAAARASAIRFLHHERTGVRGSLAEVYFVAELADKLVVLPAENQIIPPLVARAARRPPWRSGMCSSSARKLLCQALNSIGFFFRRSGNSHAAFPSVSPAPCGLELHHATTTSIGLPAAGWRARQQSIEDQV